MPQQRIRESDCWYGWYLFFKRVSRICNSFCTINLRPIFIHICICQLYTYKTNIYIYTHFIIYICIYRYLLYIFLTYIFVLMDFSHQIHGGPIFHSVGTEQRQCSCEAAARSSQRIPGQQQHKEASCARHQIFWRKEKVGLLNVGGSRF